MKSTIRVLSIISAVTLLLTFIANAICIVFQQSLGSVFGYPTSMLEGQFVIPSGIAVYSICILAVAVLQCFTAGNKKIGIWADLAIGAVIIVVLPALQKILSLVQSAAYGRLGSSYSVALSSVNNLCSIPQGIAAVAVGLALITCGMSIAYKRLGRAAE